MTLGEKLQKLRQQQGLSQDALAEQLGVSRQAVSKWERDEAVPELDKIVRLSELFGVSLDTLLKDTPPDPPWDTETPSRRRGSTVLEIVQWVGLVGGAALTAWSLTQLASALLMWQMMEGAVSGPLSEYFYVEGAEIAESFLRHGSQLFLLPLIAPAVKLLAGVALICLGLWARKKRRAQS